MFRPKSFSQGRKLLEIRRLREKGRRITLLDEKRFWKLVSRKASG